MSKRKYKYLNEKEFNNIKLLQQAGLSMNKASQVTGRSPSTTSYIFQAESYEDYKKHQKIRLMAHPPTKAKETTEATEPAQIENKSVQYMLQNINDNLVELRNLYTDMSNSLAWLEKNVIVDEPKKIKRGLW